MTFRMLILCASLAAALPAQPRAKNVILFLGDAGGLPVISTAAAYKGAPLSLFIQRMPHVGLMDTSTASAWVSDSAAGMTAIVTGRKTHKGVLPQSDTAVRGKTDGELLKTILECAEERGLSTGVITNDRVTGATPAACYAHSNDRKKSGEIFAQLLKPRFGDGVDLLIGPGKTVIAEASAVACDIETGLRDRGYIVLRSLEEFQPATRRAIVLLDSDEFDLPAAVRRTIAVLARNPKGYFLMVECDLHTDRLKRGLDRALLLDGIIEETVRGSGRDTLVLFTADHSFDTRIRGGRRGDPLLPPAGASDPAAAAKAPIRMDDGHTGEEVLVTAQGPGAERVKGFFPNTQLFHIMMAAYGWK